MTQAKLRSLPKLIFQLRSRPVRATNCLPKLTYIWIGFDFAGVLSQQESAAVVTALVMKLLPDVHGVDKVR